MKILVTGAAGFIGSSLTDRLLADGHTVVGLDNFDSFYPREVKEKNIAEARKHPRFALIEADIRDGVAIEKAIGGGRAEDGDRKSGGGWLGGRAEPFDAIVHLAAKAGVRPSIEDPVGYQETNVKGTQNLLEYARKTGVRQFVFASSSSVYGVNPRVPWREEDAVLLPISPYASTKVSGELLGHVYSHLYGIRFIGLRFFTVYGPRQRPDLAIHKFAKLMLAGKPLPFFGDGLTRRDYTYIDDIVQGLVGAIGYTGAPYEVVNLGNNRTVSLTELVAGLEQAFGRKAVLDRRPQQLGDVPQTWASVEKANRLLGYAPRTELTVGLTRFADWFSTETVD